MALQGNLKQETTGIEIVDSYVKISEIRFENRGDESCIIIVAQAWSNRDASLNNNLKPIDDRLVACLSYDEFQEEMGLSNDFRTAAYNVLKSQNDRLKDFIGV